MNKVGGENNDIKGRINEILGHQNFIRGDINKVIGDLPPHVDIHWNDLGILYVLVDDKTKDISSCPPFLSHHSIWQM